MTGADDHWPGPRVYVVTSAIVRRGGAVLLVREAVDSGAVGWSLPGGVVEPYEEMTRALAREVAQETGLRVTAVHGLAYAVQYVRATDVTLAYVFDAAAAGDVAPEDPDGSILAAGFVPAAEAVELLRQFPIRVMVEPAVAYLSGAEAPGTFWSYGDVDREPVLSARVRAAGAMGQRSARHPGRSGGWTIGEAQM